MASVLRMDLNNETAMKNDLAELLTDYQCSAPLRELQVRLSEPTRRNRRLRVVAVDEFRVPLERFTINKNEEQN